MMMMVWVMRIRCCTIWSLLAAKNAIMHTAIKRLMAMQMVFLQPWLCPAAPKQTVQSRRISGGARLRIRVGQVGGNERQRRHHPKFVELAERWGFEGEWLETNYTSPQRIVDASSAHRRRIVTAHDDGIKGTLSRGTRPAARHGRTGSLVPTARPKPTLGPEEFPERTLTLFAPRLTRGTTAFHKHDAASAA